MGSHCKLHIRSGGVGIGMALGPRPALEDFFVWHQLQAAGCTTRPSAQKEVQHLAILGGTGRFQGSHFNKLDLHAAVFSDLNPGVLLGWW